MRRSKLFYTIALCTIASAFLSFFEVMAQDFTKVPFEDDAWELIGEETVVTYYNGKKSLYMNRGAALLRDAAFKNGVLEFEIAFSESRGFPGVYFRLENDTNYEEFYMRPHQSGNPDASQYSPVNNGLSGWQLYHGPGFSGQMEYQFDTWMPVRIVVKDDEADIFVNDLENPMLHVNDLKRAPIAGGLGLRGTPGGVFFANFRYSKQTPDQLIGKSELENKAGKSTVKEWSVSNVFEENILENKTRLDKKDLSKLKWNAHLTEPSGMINLATTAALNGEKNTVFAKLNITSEVAQIKKMTLSFSDRVRVYLNGQILFSANDGFITRDYRYLGTIGDFDNVYLHLQKGDNELLIAVSESFGGWGLRASFGDTDGITW